MAPECFCVDLWERMLFRGAMFFRTFGSRVSCICAWENESRKDGYSWSLSVSIMSFASASLQCLMLFSVDQNIVQLLVNPVYIRCETFLCVSGLF